VTENLNRWRVTIIAYAPLFVWIGVIFYLSSGQGSMEQTSRFIRPLLEFLFPTATEETLSLYHGFIRKFAHLAEYAVLAYMAFRAISLKFPLTTSPRLFIYPLILVAFVASFDEINQSFEVSRTSSLFDVLIDVSGGVVMTFLLWVICRKCPSTGGA